MVLFSASQWKESTELRRDLAIAISTATQRGSDLQRANNVVHALTNPEGQHFTLVAMKTPPQPQGKAIYFKDHGKLIFLANYLPALPLQKA